MTSLEELRWREAAAALHASQDAYRRALTSAPADDAALEAALTESREAHAATLRQQRSRELALEAHISAQAATIRLQRAEQDEAQRRSGIERRLLGAELRTAERLRPPPSGGSAADPARLSASASAALALEASFAELRRRAELEHAGILRRIAGSVLQDSARDEPPQGSLQELRERYEGLKARRAVEKAAPRARTPESGRSRQDEAAQAEEQVDAAALLQVLRQQQLILRQLEEARRQPAEGGGPRQQDAVRTLERRLRGRPLSAQSADRGVANRVLRAGADASRRRRPWRA